MTFQKFLEKLNGEWVEVAGSQALNQCTDLANAYLRDVLNHPIVEWTNAKDFPSKLTEKFSYILNTPTGIPQEGDLVIWGGTYGHIAIFIEGDVNSFRSFDQNYPTGSNSHVQNHNYNNPQVLGWLHPKSSEPMATITQKELDEIIKARNNHWEELQKLKETTISKEKYDEDIRSKDNQIKERDKIIDERQVKITELLNKLTECENKSRLGNYPPEVPREDTKPEIPPLKPEFDPFTELLRWLVNLFKGSKK